MVGLAAKEGEELLAGGANGGEHVTVLLCIAYTPAGATASRYHTIGSAGPWTYSNK